MLRLFLILCVSVIIGIAGCLPVPVRTRKDAVLSFDFERSMKNYYRKHNYWPLSLSAYVADSSVNTIYLNNLYQHGFAYVDFKTSGADTLHLNFGFDTITQLRALKGQSMTSERMIEGKFIFIHYHTGQIAIERKWKK